MEPIGKVWRGGRVISNRFEKSLERGLERRLASWSA
jgi:hypothetical protein